MVSRVGTLPKWPIKPEWQLAEVQTRKNSVPRDGGCECSQHIVTIVIAASFVLKKLWATIRVTTNRLSFNDLVLIAEANLRLVRSVGPTGRWS